MTFQIHVTTNHFTTESLPGAEKKSRHTCKHCAQLGPGRQAQGAVRVVAAQRVPSTKATEHLAICEGLSVVEQRKWEALIPARVEVRNTVLLRMTALSKRLRLGRG